MLDDSKSFYQIVHAVNLFSCVIAVAIKLLERWTPELHTIRASVVFLFYMRIVNIF